MYVLSTYTVLIVDLCICCSRRMDPAVIADNLVENTATKEEVAFKELWKENTCVIIFLRRL